ncbi:hypothetical protein PPERSA_02668 [Pseudocohnilembus persalinus]|uniref:Uncharacterized protein n=1 Tax=Pseudocohnilembus persalinus TaxID=266149 RepID=A0A0V0R5M3_PSEPJ|nr:hypothetical protein PPERSA_02668 [Pseudocohnilembus persalinus]|eukprot:KRX09796.1 hypothetical protein PPERSA_02668 [Pseudocohnilembus persalinus]
MTENSKMMSKKSPNINNKNDQQYSQLMQNDTDSINFNGQSIQKISLIPKQSIYSQEINYPENSSQQILYQQQNSQQLSYQQAQILSLNSYCTNNIEKKQPTVLSYRDECNNLNTSQLQIDKKQSLQIQTNLLKSSNSGNIQTQSIKQQ